MISPEFLRHLRYLRHLGLKKAYCDNFRLIIPGSFSDLES